MRCTKEQFDSIKDKINYKNIGNFNKYPYLIHCTELDYITNTDLIHVKEIHETFNANIFLEAWGIEVEKVWKFSEMQVRFKKGKWQDLVAGDGFEYRFKPQASYSKEIEALQEKAKLNGMKAIVTFEKL